MQFAVAETTLFNQLGFNTDKWLKSLDGTLALVHYDMFKRVLEQRTEYTLYRHDDEAFEDLMMSKEWSEQVEEE